LEPILVCEGLSAAEEYTDRQARNEQFRGRQFEFVTGRPLLHAMTAGAQTLCGRDGRELAPTGRSWDAAFLPHVARCPGCVTARQPGPGKNGHSPSGAGAPAAGVDVRAAHGTEQEMAGGAALRAVLAAYDLRRWMFTDLVTVDESVRGGFSHPLTISPALLTRRPASALATFLHEQLHWIEGPASDAAAAEASTRWPDPPAPPAGAHDARSTWHHMSVCALEYHSLAQILGPAAAAAELGQHQHYTWIYAQILGDHAWFTAYLHRHGLHPTAQPPVPRRYIGDHWWTGIT
jgi:hypothetical protein